MLRVLLQYLVPLALPTLAYFLVRGWISRRAREGEPVERLPWWNAPWPWLGAAGLALMLAVLVTLSLTEGAPPQADYSPAQLEDGKVQPGGFDR